MYKAVVIGASAGGMYAIKTLLASLPGNFRIPIIIVQHLAPDSDNYLVEFLDKNTGLTVKEADEKEVVKGGFVYVCPPNYHILVEENMSISLSADEKVNYSRPSIDVLFYSAADAFQESLIGIVLTGANDDGARGLFYIKKKGGLGIVQNPSEAESPQMPTAAILEANPDHVLEIRQISKMLLQLANQNQDKNSL